MFMPSAAARCGRRPHGALERQQLVPGRGPGAADDVRPDQGVGNRSRGCVRRGPLPDAAPNLDGYPTYHHLIFHWDGSSWSNVFSTSDSAISGFGGSGPDHVFAVGALRGHRLFDALGRHQLVFVAPASEPLGAVWGGGRDEVYAVGTLGTVFKWDGGNWVVSRSWTQAPQRSTARAGSLEPAGSIFALGPGPRSCAVALRLELGGLHVVRSRASGRAGPTMRTVGRLSVPGISHWDGTQWAPTGPAMVAGLRSVWGSGADDVFAVGDQAW